MAQETRGGEGESAYDVNDYIKVLYSIDGGNTYINGLWFSYVNNGDSYDEPIALDTEFDGIGDGTILRANLQEFNFNIPDASEVIIKIAVNMDEAKEEVAFDDLIIKGTEISVPFILGSVDYLAMDSSVEWELYKAEWSSVNETIDSLFNPHVFFDGENPAHNYADHWFDTEESKFSGLSAPGDNSNFIYVTDAFHNRIIRIDFYKTYYLKLSNGDEVWEHEGHFGETVTENGTGAGFVNQPLSIDVDNDGDIYYSQSGNFFNLHQIQPKTEGDYSIYPFAVEWEGNDIMDTTRFFYPEDIAVDQNGMVYVANTNAQEIQVFNSHGRFFKKAGVENKTIDILTWESWNVQGTDTLLFDTLFTEIGEFYKVEIKGTLEKPRAVTVDSRGVIYICDTPTSRILRYRLSNQLDEDLNPIP